LKGILFLVLLYLSSNEVFSQNDQKYNSTIDLAWSLVGNGDFVNAELILKTHIDTNSFKFDKNKTAEIRNLYGSIYTGMGNYSKAIDNYEKASELNLELRNFDGLSSNYSNIGITYYTIGLYELALAYFKKSLELNNSNLTSKAETLLNIGNIFYSLSSYENAMQYYRNAFKIADSLNVIGLKIKTLLNIGNLYYAGGKNEEANKIYSRLALIAKQNEMFLDYSNALSSMGMILMDEQKYLESKVYFEKALIEYKKLGYLDGVSSSFSNLALINLEVGSFQAAKENALEGLKCAKEIGAIEIQRDLYNILYFSSRSIKDYLGALEYLEKFHVTEDSIRLNEQSRNLIESEAKINYQIKLASDSLKHIEEQKYKEAKVQKTKNIQLLLIGFVVILTLFIILLIRRYRITKKQNRIINDQKIILEKSKTEIVNQKNIIERRNNEVIDSINYAKFLQNAMLPSSDFIRSKLPNSFIFYSPKDIVAGDFYYLNTIESENDLIENIIFACADCTGHGVPGSIISFVCSGALNTAINEYKLTKPNEILDKVTEIVSLTFDNGDEFISDGMDISLLLLKKNLHLNRFTDFEWAGANRPLLIAREGNLINFTPDKQSVSSSKNIKKFTNHFGKLLKGDMIYLFSDGYVDQFGGEFERKFMSKRLKDLLIMIAENSLDFQNRKIINTFESWKGEREQTDDVCLVAISI
jgi:tetratricopeptide (TPR) repeat protein